MTLCAARHWKRSWLLNDAQETSESLYKNPLHQNYLDVCYKTGDQVKKIDEKIYFIGRNDNQIKFQGYRIELGEIERNLMEISSLSCAVAELDKEKQIIWLAYNGTIEKEKLLEIMKKITAIIHGPKKNRIYRENSLFR